MLREDSGSSTPGKGGGYRTYGDGDVTVIEHILVAKKYGFTLKEIKDLRRAMEGIDQSDVDILPLLRKKLGDVRSQMESLESLAKGLEDLIESMAREKK